MSGTTTTPTVGNYTATTASATTSGSNQSSTSNRSSSISSSSVSARRYTLQEAQGLALQAFQNAIGRAPTSDELSNFLSALNAAEARSPQVTSGGTYTSRTKTGSKGQADTVGSTSSSNTTSGGVDEQAFAQQYAMSLPGASEYQKATTYFDAFNQVMNSRGGTGL
jgi:hypothetical protein